MKQSYRDCTKNVNGVTVKTRCKDIVVGDAFLLVEAGNTGYLPDEPRRTGSRVFFRIAFNRGDFCLIPSLDESGNIVGVMVARCGDDALEAMELALRHGFNTLFHDSVGLILNEAMLLFSSKK